MSKKTVWDIIIGLFWIAGLVCIFWVTGEILGVQDEIHLMKGFNVALDSIASINQDLKRCNMEETTDKDWERFAIRIVTLQTIIEFEGYDKLSVKQGRTTLVTLCNDLMRIVDLGRGLSYQHRMKLDSLKAPLSKKQLRIIPVPAYKSQATRITI
jgi:hypothetical protein